MSGCSGYSGYSGCSLQVHNGWRQAGGLMLRADEKGVDAWCEALG